MDSRRDFTSKKVFPGYFPELSEKANSGLHSAYLKKANSAHIEASRGSPIEPGCDKTDNALAD